MNGLIIIYIFMAIMAIALLIATGEYKNKKHA
jgi:hypothetical protein